MSKPTLMRGHIPSGVDSSAKVQHFLQICKNKTSTPQSHQTAYLSSTRTRIVLAQYLYAKNVDVL